MTNLTRDSLLLALGLALAACGDGDKQTPADAPPPIDAAPIDTPPPIDGPVAYMPPMALPIDISAGGPDQLQSVTPGPDGSFYAAGFFAETPTGARALTVLKAKGTGQPDVTFGGDDGFADITDVDFKGGNDEIDVATQADGKIVISATVAATTPAVTGDTDIVVVRLLTTGALDPSFGTGGIKRVDLNTGAIATIDGNMRLRGDNARSLTVNDAGIFVHALSRAVGADRVDQDFTVVKLGLVDGAVDEAFGNQTDAQKGQFRQNFDREDVAARGIKTLADGNLLAVGYATIPPGAGQPVLYKLTPAGQLVTTFNPGGAIPGVFHAGVLATQTEVYNVAIHGDKIVTGGYGRELATPNVNNYVSLRFDLATGARDTTWGGATNGVVIFDPSGAGISANCRGAHALPNGKTLLVGSFGSNGPVQDAIFAVLDADGKLDKTFGTGINAYKLGTDGNDQFWGAAVSGNRVAVVGYKGASAQSATVNDDSFGVLFNVQ